MYGGTAALSFLTAYMLRFDFSVPVMYQGTLVATTALLVAVRLATNAAFRLSSERWRFVGIDDLQRLGMAVATGSAVFGLVVWVLPWIEVPRSILLIEPGLTLLGISGVWITYRRAYELLRERANPQGRASRVLIVGAGEAGNRLAAELTRYSSQRVPVGFVDDDPMKWGATIRRLAVIGGTNDLPSIAETTAADEVVIAIPSASSDDFRRIIDICVRAGLAFRTLPRLFDGAAAGAEVQRAPVVEDPDASPTGRRDAYLPFAIPDVGEDEIAEVVESLRSRWVTTGPRTRDFEDTLKGLVGATHAVAVNSCTAAMHVALEASGLRRGDLILTTPYTFAATTEVAEYFGAVPVLVDVEAELLNMDMALLAETADAVALGLARGTDTGMPTVDKALKVARTLTGDHPARLMSVIPVHVAGHPCDMDGLLSVARKHRLAVIEDAAHALPTSRNGVMVGADITDPDIPHHAACFSFYATKTITTGEGGMLTTRDEAFADRCRMMSLHGMSRDGWKRYRKDGTWYYEILAPGFKYNMTDTAAAMGLVQLRRMNELVERRGWIAAQYTRAFAGVDALQIPSSEEGVGHSWHLYMLRLNLDRLTVDRAGFWTELQRRNIGASVHFIPIHFHPYYRDRYGFEDGDLPVAAREYRRELSLPIYSGMTADDVESVIDAVLDVVRCFRA